MPFSFMNFVIKDKIEIKDPLVKNNIFDPTPYNYLFESLIAIIFNLYGCKLYGKFKIYLSII